jgi:hypothetical protein
MALCECDTVVLGRIKSSDFYCVTLIWCISRREIYVFAFKITTRFASKISSTCFRLLLDVYGLLRGRYKYIMYRQHSCVMTALN